MPNGDNAAWLDDPDDEIFLKKFGFVMGDKTHHNLCCIILLIIKKKIDFLNETQSSWVVWSIASALGDPFNILCHVFEITISKKISKAGKKAFEGDMISLTENTDHKEQIIVLYCIEKIKEICYQISGIQGTIQNLARMAGEEDVSNLVSKDNIVNIIGFFIFLQIPDINEQKCISRGGAGLVNVTMKSVKEKCYYLISNLRSHLHDFLDVDYYNVEDEEDYDIWNELLNEPGKIEDPVDHPNCNKATIRAELKLISKDSPLSDMVEEKVVDAVYDANRRRRSFTLERVKNAARRMRNSATRKMRVGRKYFFTPPFRKKKLGEVIHENAAEEESDVEEESDAKKSGEENKFNVEEVLLGETNKHLKTFKTLIEKNHIPILDYIGSLIDMSDLDNENILTIFDIKLVNVPTSNNPNFIITVLNQKIQPASGAEEGGGGKIRKRKRRKSKKKGQRKSKKKGQRKSKRKGRRKSKRKVRRHRIRTRK